ncbi:RagB/SusD family nutrient uptake outer membrane protein [Fulvivirgaceae bacterium PWU4]|uniref:RagB/SusD family nutrient uptake outer membrane protein n=1 Tax=Chryseosolibacter histidini TaxID=2782349 RepID=A0AAP2DJ69_9BACT|nr:RagB/SusD family nutrient uptake outer membrane protein [Chryseosolibacter histidini]MBT1697321.1 RagB/SusD family nutrient uptake outer membrane protein [Chryseosolibacter histidini]
MKKISLYILLAAAVTVLSCNDDFLNVTPTSLTDEAIWKDAGLTEAYIINLYTGIRLTDKEASKDERYIGFGRGFHWAMYASVTDEAVYSNNDQTYLVQRAELSPSNYGWMSTVWGRSYRSIREANLVLEKIPSTPLTEERRAMLVAEIRFIRAFRYFDLLKGFGGVPIVGDEVTELTDDFTPLYQRKSIAETVSYIVNELNAVIGTLPNEAGSTWERGRATTPAAMALKSRVLLYAASPLYTGGTSDVSKWQAAATAAKNVMDLNKFSLVTNLSANPAENYRLYFVAPPTTTEDIFFREYTNTSPSMAMERMNAPNGYGGWGGNCPMQNLVDDYEMTNGLPITDAGSGYNAQNPYVNRDPRFYGTILYNGADYRGRKIETFLPGGKDSPDGNEPWNSSPTGYYLRKFLKETITLDDWSNMGTATWRYFRYAEILLNYAEAQNEATGPDQSVYDAVNAVRLRAGMPALPGGLSKDQMRARIRNERRVELAYEEHRYFDVRRWMIADVQENEQASGISITKNGDGSLTYATKVALTNKAFKTQHYWFPIPIEEINASKGAITQNPLYE